MGIISILLTLSNEREKKLYHALSTSTLLQSMHKENQRLQRNNVVTPVRTRFPPLTRDGDEALAAATERMHSMLPGGKEGEKMSTDTFLGACRL